MQMTLNFYCNDADTSNRITARWHDYHTHHPEVYHELVRLARNVKKHGQRVGIATLYEVLRHDYLMASSEHLHGLNNNYRSRYARLIMLLEPDLKGFFEVRHCPSTFSCHSG